MLVLFFLVVLVAYMHDNWSGLFNSHRDLKYLKKKNSEIWSIIRADFSSALNFLRASLVAWLVKNPPAMWETWVQSLGWEDPLEKGKATHSSILA